MRFTGVFLSVFAAAMIGVTLVSSAAIAAPPTASPIPSSVAAPAVSPAPETPPAAAGTPVGDATPGPNAAPTQIAAETAATPLPPSTLTSAFQNALAAFQKGDFKSAREWFRETLVKDPVQIVAWYDLGLTEQKLGNAGLAMAFWRKALSLSPTFSPAQHALKYTREHLEHADIPHEVETWESLRSSLLVYLTASQFAFIAAILFFIAGWFALTFTGVRRRAILDEKPLPAFPVIASLCALGFVIVFILAICKVVDDQDLRATIIAKKVEAKALPDPASTNLFDLYEGLEVIVRQTNKDWIQVTYPGGATGWIPRDALFTMADKVTP